MNQMEDARKTYEKIAVPKELSERITAEVEKAEQKRRRKLELRRKGLARGLAAAASVMVVFTAAVNTSTAFAESVRGLPVIGAAARVLTFRSYETEQEDLKISVEIPSIEMIEQDTGELEGTVNQEIYSLCQQYAEEAVKRAEEYRQAFLDTGGTEEEWAAHKIEIKVWYEIKSQSDRYLSLAVMGTESWTSAYSETRYYNFDWLKGRRVTLRDMLGENYSQIAEDSIRSQIREQEKDGKIFWSEELPEITESTAFYINETGNPVIVFEKYEIAPGASGAQEFEISIQKGEETL